MNDFLNKLNKLDLEFSQLKPELEVSVFDRKNKMEGYVVVWNTIHADDAPLGRAGKGGTRITPTVSLDEVRMLARIMSLKNASAGLPLGGAKSGLRADPNQENFEKTYKCFVSSVKNTLCEFGGLYGGFGFDLGAKPIHAKWAMEVLGSGKSFTGKTLDLGGTDYDREGLAGYGVAIAARTWINETKQNIANISCSIQGLGAMGAAVFRYFSEFGGKVHYISDPRIGGTFKLKETLPKEFIASITNMDFEETKRLLPSVSQSSLPLEAVLYQEVDINFPCAVQDVINVDNFNLIKSKALVEGANNPCSTEARTKLFQKGITVIPDFVANAGGIIAAYVEMTSKVSIEENVKTKANVIASKNMTEEKINANVSRMLKEADRLGVEPTLVARYFALERILS
jgi:glutamate dehydrogenase (NAD(P)+)